jgi:glutaminase
MVLLQEMEGDAFAAKGGGVRLAGLTRRVSPGKFGIRVVSPPLDEAGNSVRAQKAIADVSNALGGNPYAAKPR